MPYLFYLLWFRIPNRIAKKDNIFKLKTNENHAVYVLSQSPLSMLLANRTGTGHIFTLPQINIPAAL
jgi:hypothetical protein